MAFSEHELRRYQKTLDKFIETKRPPAHVRAQLDFRSRIEGQSVFIFEVRPRWDNANELSESPIAKATYVKSTNSWKIYWQRADMKWHAYEPCRAAATLDEFLQVVDEDEYSCFFG